jgi:thioredoxin 1
VFAKVDTEAEPGIAEAFQIQSIPPLMVIRDGVVLGMEAGIMPGEAIDDVIRQVKALDMDEVRKNARDEPPVHTP